jgi:hypothetical protein
MKTKNEILAEIKFTLIKKHNIDALDDALINDCVEMTLKAINYTRCCETLKDKKKITFDEWLGKWDWERIGSSYTFKRGESYTTDLCNSSSVIN